MKRTVLSIGVWPRNSWTARKFPVRRVGVVVNLVRFDDGVRLRNAPGSSASGGLAVSHWKVIMSVRLSVVAFGFKGSFAKFALPEFKTL